MKTHDEMGPLYGMSTFYFFTVGINPKLFSWPVQSVHGEHPPPKRLVYDIHTTRLHGIAASVPMAKRLHAFGITVWC